MITNNNACPSAVRNALLSSLMLLVLIGPGLCCAKAQPTHRIHEPFCRRSHYVTYPSAPCWN